MNGYCPRCGARTQINVDGETVHSRLGTLECPEVPVPEMTWEEASARFGVTQGVRWYAFTRDHPIARRMSESLTRRRRNMR